MAYTCLNHYLSLARLRAFPFLRRCETCARPCAGAMICAEFLDASNSAHTSALLAGLQAKTSSSSFWNSCAASLYTSVQCSSGLPANVSQSAPFQSVTANSSVHGLADSMRTRPLTAPRTNQLKTLPCPVLYQAKEPEAIADVLRRAGKKALGGGIPGRPCSDLVSPHSLLVEQPHRMPIETTPHTVLDFTSTTWWGPSKKMPFGRQIRQLPMMHIGVGLP